MTAVDEDFGQCALTMAATARLMVSQVSAEGKTVWRWRSASSFSGLGSGSAPAAVDRPPRAAARLLSDDPSLLRTRRAKNRRLDALNHGAFLSGGARREDAGGRGRKRMLSDDGADVMYRIIESIVKSHQQQRWSASNAERRSQDYFTPR